MRIPCHRDPRTITFDSRAISPNVLPPNIAAVANGTEVCEYCGDATLAWRKCKQLCTSCGNINRSCADL